MTKIRVLLIDDDEASIAAIRSLLVAAHMQVFTLDSPIGATQLIVREQVECVVCDLDMPAMRGDAFARFFRKTRLFDNVRLILLSAASLDELRAVEASGVADIVVHKSEARARLVSLVQRAVSSRPPPHGRP